MNDQKPYNTLEVPGSFLVPGFSIYLLEIKRENEKWFYIGMTGDPHYPSARAAFHRISGHLELASKSTQNQLRIALTEKCGVVDDCDLKGIKIKMHHFPIEGFSRLTKEKLSKAVVKQLKPTQGYKSYKLMQQKVLELEKALIFALKAKLLNKTAGLKPKTTEIPYPEIYNSIIELVNNG